MAAAAMPKQPGSSPQTPPTLRRFCNLPTELRLQIWREALTFRHLVLARAHGRASEHLPFYGPYEVARACREAWAVWLDVRGAYQLVPRWPCARRVRPVLVNLETSVVYICGRDQPLTMTWLHLLPTEVRGRIRHIALATEADDDLLWRTQLLTNVCPGAETLTIVEPGYRGWRRIQSVEGYHQPCYCDEESSSGTSQPKLEPAQLWRLLAAKDTRVLPADVVEQPDLGKVDTGSGYDKLRHACREWNWPRGPDGKMPVGLRAWRCPTSDSSVSADSHPVKQEATVVTICGTEPTMPAHYDWHDSYLDRRTSYEVKMFRGWWGID